MIRARKDGSSDRTWHGYGVRMRRAVGTGMRRADAIRLRRADGTGALPPPIRAHRVTMKWNGTAHAARNSGTAGTGTARAPHKAAASANALHTRATPAARADTHPPPPPPPPPPPRRRQC
eukprot:6029905-Prymnesium_polylepis.3